MKAQEAIEIAILPDSYNEDWAVAEALEKGGTSDLRVLKTLAERYPNAKFYRPDEPNNKFGSITIMAALSCEVDPR